MHIFIWRHDDGGRNVDKNKAVTATSFERPLQFNIADTTFAISAHISSPSPKNTKTFPISIGGTNDEPSLNRSHVNVATLVMAFTNGLEMKDKQGYTPL